ncbi:MAG: phosphate acyltransferase [Deltaproteobacteria bacterium]|nr:phosphate acyltransferase [Deltaproteobacteria bacterium]
MIRTFEDIDRLAPEKGPKKLIVLAPEDEEFMLAVKHSWQRGYIEPVLIGSRDKIERLAGQVEFDIAPFEKIFESDRQGIANLGISMLFSGEVDIAGKGQIPTSFIYRSIIREESKVRKGTMVSVIGLWDIAGLGHLTSITDPGVNINPDYESKIEILKNAVFLFHLLGYPKPRISVLSGQREIGGTLESYSDFTKLREVAQEGELGSCEVIEATSFAEIFLPGRKVFSRISDIDIGKTAFPEILLAPNLTTGNILTKLDLVIPRFRRRSLIMTSRGPVVIPARSDFHDSITGEIALGVVIADRVRKA